MSLSSVCGRGSSDLPLQGRQEIRCDLSDYFSQGAPGGFTILPGPRGLETRPANQKLFTAVPKEGSGPGGRRAGPRPGRDSRDRRSSPLEPRGWGQRLWQLVGEGVLSTD